MAIFYLSTSSLSSLTQHNHSKKKTKLGTSSAVRTGRATGHAAEEVAFLSLLFFLVYLCREATQSLLLLSLSQHDLVGKL